MEDTLSWLKTHLEPEAVQAILDVATMGTSQRAEGENPAIIESDQQLEKEVQVAAGQVLVESMSPIGQQLKKRTLSWMQFYSG